MRYKKLALIGFLFCYGALMCASYFFWDLSVASWVHMQNFSDQFKHVLTVLTHVGLGSYEILFFLSLLAISYLCRSIKTSVFSVYVLFSIIISGVTCDLLKVIFARTRPVEYFQHHLYGFTFSIFHRVDTYHFMSFPSGHTTTAASIAFAIYFVYPKWRVPAVMGALIVAATRVLLLKHYVSDVMGGLILGAICSAMLYQVLYNRYLLKQPGRLVR